MKILVTVKSVIDPDSKIQIDASGKAVDVAGAVFIVNPFDAIAIEEAVRMREKGIDIEEIVVVSIGGQEYEKNLRTALAMGADRGILVETGRELDPWNVSSLLESIVATEGPDLVLMGKQAVDDDSNQVGQFLAAKLDWPQATFVSKIEFVESDRMNIERESDLGIESLALNLPALITCDLRLNEPRYTALPAILKAKRKPLEVVSADSLVVELAPRVEVVSMKATSRSRECVYVDSADELISRLRDEAKVLS